MADARPLFIVGSMRSGTTWVRDLLRRIPGFICPEETHFMRWSDPFRSPGGLRPHRRNALLRRHREIDGVDEATFDLLLRRCANKAELQRRYVGAFAQANRIDAPFRWFDKTPQNIYGLPLILGQFPRARVLHLVRNPLNVVSSLQLGRQVKIPDLQGAINCWSEAVEIWDAMAPLAPPSRMLELRYEDILADVPAAMTRIAAFADIPHPDHLWSVGDGRADVDQWRRVLSPTAAARVARRCGPIAASRGYDLGAMIAAHTARAA
nr:sulfotransferase [Hasllibacter sp. MH4015]